ncbi:hypothetical protein KC865_02540 [Candidatus Kaiserbacteria bacterium]|nr:hypothetical protein [Candidatus Kaiserbacteria bacterium]USN91870.1 MAG: hypothetical protein H6782_03275 [Candidatus Nomurabacteria bacterium]
MTTKQKVRFFHDEATGLDHPINERMAKCLICSTDDEPHMHETQYVQANVCTEEWNTWRKRLQEFTNERLGIWGHDGTFIVALIFTYFSVVIWLTVNNIESLLATGFSYTFSIALLTAIVGALLVSLLYLKYTRKSDRERMALETQFRRDNPRYAELLGKTQDL